MSPRAHSFNYPKARLKRRTSVIPEVDNLAKKVTVGRQTKNGLFCKSVVAYSANSSAKIISKFSKLGETCVTRIGKGEK